MTKDVLVTVKGLHTNAGSGEDTVELTCPGSYGCKNGRHLVVYEERDEDGAATRTLMKFSDQMLEVTRRGRVSSHLLFEKGRKNLSTYKTPYGEILLGVAATGISLAEEEDLIRFTVAYEMDMNGELANESRVTLLIHPAKRR